MQETNNVTAGGERSWVEGTQEEAVGTGEGDTACSLVSFGF